MDQERVKKRLDTTQTGLQPMLHKAWRDLTCMTMLSLMHGNALIRAWRCSQVRTGLLSFAHGDALSSV